MLVRVPDHLHCKCQEEAGDHVETSTLGRDVEARVVVLALRAPLNVQAWSRLVQQAQSDARVLSSCQASLLEREQQVVAVHRVPCLLQGGTIGIRPEMRCPEAILSPRPRAPSSELEGGDRRQSRPTSCDFNVM